MAPSIRLLASLLVIPLAIVIALYFPFNTHSDFGLADIFGFSTGSPPKPIAGPTVRDLVSGITYIGKAGGDVEQYLGIPYAQDTSGVNRFAPPKPLSQKAGTVIEATKSGSWCPQGTGDLLPFTSRIDDISEDCLSLGITRPRGVKADARLPVFVWMHGGGHALGSYADQLYAPEGFVQQSAADGKPVIFVGINYRLGVFGFARSKALSKAGHTNMGLRDQRAAFEWVKKNIAAFGGDSENIISIGQSVGASDTGLHITSYGGKKGVPFNKAIMMSGAPTLTFNLHSDQVDKNTASIAQQLGCAIDGDTQSDESLKCLQNIPMEKLNNVSITAMRTARPPFGEAYFFPTLDNDYIPDRPSNLYRQRKFVQDIPVMASWVTNDGAWYAPPPTSTDEEVTNSFGLWLTNLSKSTLTKLLELYPITDFEDIAGPTSKIGGLSPQYYRAAQMNKDLWFTCPVLDFTYHHALHSNPSRAATYIYEANATRFGPIFKDIMGVPFWGVSHLSDIPYVLNNDVAAGGDNSPSAKALAREMSRAVVNFGYDGHPGGNWPVAWGHNGDNSVDLDEIRLMLWRDEREGRSGPVTVRRGVEGEGQNTRAVEWERLFERCDFINSAKVREEIGV